MASESSELSKKLLLALEDNNEIFVETCKHIASDIEAGKIKLFEVVTELGELFTSTENLKRLNGVRSLSTILSKLSPDFLNEQEVNLMTTFYCERLKDHHSLIPTVVVGILSIVQMKNLPKDASVKLFHGISQDIRCQVEEQETRGNIYLIFKVLLETSAENLKAIGPDFIYGIISAIDPEGDPRNLVLLFSFLPKLMKEFPLGHLTEEMFECLSRYFPVDFNPKKTTGPVITREQLSDGLENCLSAIPEFAEFCIPLVIEKLSSNMKLAKLESLRLLSKSASTFDAGGFKPHLDELWPVLRSELLPGSDVEIKTASLDALENVVKAISKDETTTERFVNMIVTDTRSSLSDVELSLFSPSEQILEATAKASKNTCIQVLTVIVPLCLAQYSTKTTTVEKASLMETLNNFIHISSRHGFSISHVNELTWADIPGLYLNELSGHENSLKTKAILGLSLQNYFLNETQRRSLYDKICTEIDAGNLELENSCHMALSVFAESHPKEILQVFSEKLEIDVEKTKKMILQHRLHALSSIAAIPALAPSILPAIIKVAVSESSELNSTALSCLEKLVLDKSSDIHNFLQKNCGVIERLLSSTSDGNRENFLLISRNCCLIMRNLKTNEQEKAMAKHFEGLRKNIVQNIVLLEGLMTPLYPNVASSYISEYLLVQLLELSLTGKEENSRVSASKLLAVMMNKIEENISFREFLNIFRQGVTNILEATSTIDEKKSAIIFYAWLTKALIMRGSSRSQEFLDYYFEILRNEEIGEFAAEQFRTIIDKNEKTLTTENFCTVKLFFKQRVFQNLLKQHETFKDCAANNYLITLVNLVEETPMDLLLLHLSKIVPLLVEVLSMDNSQLVLSTLKTLKPIIDTKHKIFGLQIENFLPACLNLSTHFSMHVRIAALNCIYSYCSYPKEIIQFYKDLVIDKIAPALDDKKRLVRQIATKTRTRWYLVDSPGGLE